MLDADALVVDEVLVGESRTMSGWEPPQPESAMSATMIVADVDDSDFNRTKFDGNQYEGERERSLRLSSTTRNDSSPR